MIALSKPILLRAQSVVLEEMIRNWEGTSGAARCNPVAAVHHPARLTLDLPAIGWASLATQYSPGSKPSAWSYDRQISATDTTPIRVSPLNAVPHLLHFGWRSRCR